MSEALQKSSCGECGKVNTTKYMYDGAGVTCCNKHCYDEYMKNPKDYGSQLLKAAQDGVLLEFLKTTKHMPLVLNKELHL